MNGLCLLHKPPSVTSHGALESLKKKCATRRIGHTGTLDRFASGLLVVLTGKYTRLSGLFMPLEKEYRAEIVFGTGTDTLDPDGRVTATGPVPAFDALQAAAGRFLGAIRQKPPEFSAVHVDGKRAYEYARRGEAVDPAAREVFIHSLVLLDYQPPQAVLSVVCSKGTYIRSLARDIASALGTCAHVQTLRRTRIGAFLLEEAVSPDQFDPGQHLLTADRFIDRLPGVLRATVKSVYLDHIRIGKTLEDDFFKKPLAQGLNAVFSEEGRLVAVVNRLGMNISYEMVLTD